MDDPDDSGRVSHDTDLQRRIRLMTTLAELQAKEAEIIDYNNS